MKISKLIAQLEKIQASKGKDIEVMFSDPNGNGNIFSVGIVKFTVAERGEFPDEWEMPEGFKFVHLKH